MKIGILTQPLGLNYGGIVQNFALQTVLKKHGFHPYTYNRTWGKKSISIKDIVLFVKNHTIDHFRGKHKYMLTEKEREYICKNSYDFMSKHMNVSPILYNFNEFIDIYKKHKANAVIVGSDQVWRPMYSPQIGNYFLDFLNDDKHVKKISYAASFGTSDWEFSAKDTVLAKNNIKHFDAISVREKSGIQLCEKYLNAKAEWVLDPTLLLEQEDYIQVTKGYNLNRKGIFAYVLDKGKEINTVIDKITNNLDLPTFTNQPKFAQSQNASKNLEDYILPPIEGWISAFHEADFVITDSFHGTVFAIIFNKPFYVVVNQGRGSARFESLLEIFNLKDRIVNPSNVVESLKTMKEIDYNTVNQIKKNLQTKGINFLLNSLK